MNREIEAVIVAAGFSSRAGAFKMELDLDGKTVIERCVEAMSPFCSRIIVVGGYKIEKLETILKKYPQVEIVLNRRFAEGMFTSVKEGVRQVRGEKFFFSPGDYPLISGEVCRKLLTEKGEILIPIFQGHKGHPVLFSAGMAEELLEAPDSSNLRDFIRRKGYQTVVVEDEGILMDLDTPDDYEQILKRARARSRGGVLMSCEINVPIQKVDHQEKVTGQAAYIGDIKFPGMLYAKTLRSQKARAWIKAIHKPQLPEGYFIVDSSDIPGQNRVKIVIHDQPFFAEDKVNYIGEPILLVVGPEKQTILEILAQIQVDYQEIPAILTMEDAENPDLKPIFEDKRYFADYHISKGHPEACFEEDQYIFEEEFETGYQEQLYIEPQGVTAVYENNQITVYGSIQCPYYVRDALMQAFGWGSERVRVVQTTVGGAFGGKEDYPSLIGGQVAVAAYKTGKPVQLIFDRSEDLEVTTKRHPCIIRLKAVVDKDYRITALEADIRYNAGAYCGLSNVVLQRGMFNIAGVYQIPNMKVRGRSVVTNTVPNGAYRGFGAPQAIFAIEMMMEIIAGKLGMEVLELKIKHLVQKGQLTTTSGTFRQEIKLPELIETVEQLSSYRQKRREFGNGKEKVLRGIGMSLFLHGCGFTGSGERDFIKAQVKLRRSPDGKVEILAANTDMGQGLKTTFRKIVASSLALPVESIIYQNPDTTRVPNSGPTVASRTVMIVGKLLEQAALKMKQRWNEPGEIEIIENYRHPKDMQWDDATFRGDAYPAFSWGVNAVEVEVDPLTLEINLKGIWSAYDVGKAIDDRIIRGQIEGGILQGLGYGSLEKMECRQGKLQQRSVTDYIIPTAMDGVKMEHRLIDNPYADGPFGAKGAGELTLIGGAPALAAAVSNALGVPLHRLPITPEYLMEVLKNGKTN